MCDRGRSGNSEPQVRMVVLGISSRRIVVFGRVIPCCRDLQMPDRPGHGLHGLSGQFEALRVGILGR